jgi:hypothetical protein
MACLCVSQQAAREVQKATPQKKSVLGKVHVKSLLPKKLRKITAFPVVFSLRFCFIAFLAVSLHEELKNTIKILLKKIRPENPKKSQKKNQTWK